MSVLSQFLFNIFRHELRTVAQVLSLRRNPFARLLSPSAGISLQCSNENLSTEEEALILVAYFPFFFVSQ